MRWGGEMQICIAPQTANHLQPTTHRKPQFKTQQTTIEKSSKAGATCTQGCSSLTKSEEARRSPALGFWVLGFGFDLDGFMFWVWHLYGEVTWNCRTHLRESKGYGDGDCKVMGGHR